uniref:t-SNARE coiled-coil homology domain-containing protein n=1 Tax=Ananas comosus var. bracteatus TaxID=296719 RepID=A0A6V7P5W4_ANACO|nr:unnamed protein product [Ananas comosus var. bracteatus]
MNNLMTTSFLDYVELKKQATVIEGSGASPEASADLEAGGLTPAEEANLALFFSEVGAIQSAMDALSALLSDLRLLHAESRSAHSAKLLRGLRDRVESDVAAILRTAHSIKAQLEALDASNAANRALSPRFAAGTPVDRTRVSVTHGIRAKLRDAMIGFQKLRETILSDHKETLKQNYYNATGELASDKVLDEMLKWSGRVEAVNKEEGMDVEVMERNRAVSEIQRSLMQLHQVFLDMAVMVEKQKEQMNDIEENVVRAKEYVSGARTASSRRRP